MVPYKKLFTHEELQEVCEWMEKNKSRFPKSLQLNNSTFIEDFPTVVGYYIDIVELHKDNPTYSGQIHQIFQMQQKLKEMWGEE